MYRTCPGTVLRYQPVSSPSWSQAPMLTRLITRYRHTISELVPAEKSPCHLIMLFVHHVQNCCNSLRQFHESKAVKADALQLLSVVHNFCSCANTALYSCENAATVLQHLAYAAARNAVRGHSPDCQSNNEVIIYVIF